MVEAGFPKRSCSPKIELTAAALAPQFNSSFKPPPFLGGARLWRLGRTPCAAHSDDARASRCNARSRADGCRRSGGYPSRPAGKRDVADALAEPRAAFRGAVAGRDDLQPRQALLDNLAGIGMVVLRRWFEKYNHAGNAAMLRPSAMWGAYGMRLFAAVFFVVLAWGLAWGVGSRYGARILSVCGILRRAALSLLSQLRRVDRRGRLAGAAAFSATMLLWLRAPVESLHVPGGSLVQIGSLTRLKARRPDP